ncbi:MAG: HD domain-containing protein [Christensenella sp.]
MHIHTLKMIDVIGIFQRGLNHIDRRLIDHGIRVAYIAYHMLKAAKIYDDNAIHEIAFVVLMHDIGAYKTEEIDRMLEFESVNMWGHSVYGYLFVKKLTPFSKWAPAVLFHHTAFKDLADIDTPYKDIAQIIHVADRVDMYMQANNIAAIDNVFSKGENTRFSKEVLDLFYYVKDNDNILDKLLDGRYKHELYNYLGDSGFSNETIYAFLKMTMYVIDFRSVFTVTHTITTVGISDRIGKLMGISELDAYELHTGALLHDLGKISIPLEILEKNGKLTPQEMDVMRTHVDITEDIIGHYIDDAILQNAIRHHEKMDGSGYPRGLTGKDLTLTQRIVAVADIISALNGQRSYKEAYPKEKIINILSNMSDNGKLCREVTATVVNNFDDIMHNVQKQYEPIINLYENIQSEYVTLKERCSKITDS